MFQEAGAGAAAGEGGTLPKTIPFIEHVHVYYLNKKNYNKSEILLSVKPKQKL